MEADLLRICAGVLGVAGLAVLVASLVVRDAAVRRSVRVLYAVEFLTVGWIVLPAWLGAPALAVALVPLAFVAQRELLTLGVTEAEGPLEWLAMGLGAAIVLAAPHGARPVGALWVLGSLALAAANTFSTGGVDRLSRSATSLLLPGICLAHLVWLSAMPNGFGYVVFLYGVVECTDSFAYLFGKLFGRRKIFPRLSPNKTWAGVVGGAACGVGAGLLIGSRIPGVPLPLVGVAAALVVALTVLGDLAASRLKRAAGVKDFGDVLPGHGGILDTYDTLIFVAPPFTHLALAWHGS